MKGHVLIVDDNRAVRELTVDMITHLGWQATAAHSGHHALELLDAEDFDLILMDCEMPIINGLETTRLAFERVERPPPIIAISAHQSLMHQRACKQVGMSGHLRKPFDLAQLGWLLYQHQKKD